MFNRFNQDHPDLDEAIADAFRDLKGFHAQEPEHKAAMEQITELYALKKKRLDPNTVLTVAGNLAIGLAVIKHEQTAVVTSKVWSFLMKK